MSISKSVKKSNKVAKILSKTEERELILQAQKGDENAKNEIIIKNYRFVLKIAYKYKNRYLDIEDIVNEGIIGMMTAIQKFDLKKDIKFISYSVFWIKQSIIKAIAEKMQSFKVPLNVNNYFYHINKTKDSQLTSSQVVDNLSKELNLSKKKINHFMLVNKKPISIDTPILNGKNDSTISDRLIDDKSSSIEKKVMDNDLKKKVKNILKKVLNPIENIIISDRYGLENGRCLTLSEIGREIHYTKERVRQLETIALKKLAKYFKKDDYNTLLGFM